MTKTYLPRCQGSRDLSEEKVVMDIRSLCNGDKEDVLSDMQDWGTYMYCKEDHERSKENLNKKDLPCIRGGYDLSASEEGSSYIKYKRSPVKNMNYDTNSGSTAAGSEYIVPDFTQAQIRSHEHANKEIDKEEEERREQMATIHRARGNQAFNSGDFEKACEHYSECILNSNCIQAYNNRAQANMKMGNHSSAIPDLNHVLRQDATNQKALYRRAVCREKVFMFREALHDAETLMRHHPSSTSAKKLCEQIRESMAQLKGRFYRIREHFEPCSTFKVERSQLSAYATAANDRNSYLIEVDRTGCDKNCVCGYCTSEDRLTRTKSTGLRIKERVRWKLITFELVEEMENDPAVKMYNAKNPKSKTETPQNPVNSKETLCKSKTKAEASSHNMNNLPPKVGCESSKSAAFQQSVDQCVASEAKHFFTNKVENLINDLNLASNLT